jgi:acyl-ACP thioesterase
MYEFESAIRYSECSPDGKLSVPSLINYFQDVSTFHSESIGEGVFSLKERSLGWMILSWDIKIDSLPGLGDRIRTGTMSLGAKGIYALRDFVMRSDDKIYARAHSIWGLIDLNRLMPVKPDQKMMDKFGAEDPLPGEWAGRKMKEPIDKEKVMEIEAGFFMLDSNGHVNNEKYIELIMSALKLKDIKRLTVSYRNQALLGDKLIVWRGKGEDEGLSSIERDDGTVLTVIKYQY